MKLYISYALTSLLLAAPLAASHDDDKAAQVQKEATQKDDEAASAPIAKKIAQTLWKHKGKVALGTSILILAALAYLYRESLLAFCGWENTPDLKPAVTENTAQTPNPAAQPDLKNATAEPAKVVPLQATDEKNIMPDTTFAAKIEKALELGNKEKVEFANEMVREDPTLAIVTNESGKGTIVSPVPSSEKEQAAASLELVPVSLTAPEAMPSAPLQESVPAQETPSETPVTVNADAESINSDDPWFGWKWLSRFTTLFSTTDTPVTPSVPGDQQS